MKQALKHLRSDKKRFFRDMLEQMGVLAAHRMLQRLLKKRPNVIQFETLTRDGLPKNKSFQKQRMLTLGILLKPIRGYYF